MAKKRKVAEELVEWTWPTDKELDRFFAVLGRGVATFVMIEDALYTGFEYAVRPGHVGVAMCAFHAVQHSQTKLNMTDAAIRSLLAGNAPARVEMVEEWDKLKRTCEKMLRRRNELAHFQTLVSPGRKGERRVVMRPQMLDARHAIGIKKYVEHPISSIEEITKRFREVAGDLASFYGRLPEPTRQWVKK